MNAPVNRLRGFVAELKTRGVYRTAAYYCAAAWALLQVADLFSPVFGLPDDSVTIVLIFAAIGFIPALLLSWWFDLTPDGIVSASTTAELTPRDRRQTKPQYLELTLILALIVLVAYLYVERLTPEPPPVIETVSAPTEKPSIAIMPFVNMSASEDLGYLGDGLAEEILNLLARFKELDVAARTSSFFYRDTDLDIHNVAYRLGVKNLLEGSVRREEQRIRVTVKLVETRRGYQLWSETYDRDMGSLLGLQEDIARSVVDALQVVLSEQSRQLLSRGYDIEPVAYDYYLKGRDYLRKQVDEFNLDTGLELLYRATDISADFPDAWAGICDGELARYDISRNSEEYKNAEYACQRALKLDANSVATLVALGNLYRVSGKYDESVSTFSKALAINAGAVDAWRGQGKAFAEMKQYERMERSFLRAIELDPGYWGAKNDLAAYYFKAGRYQNAIAMWQDVVSLNPASESALNNLGIALFMTGEPALAAEVWEKSVALAPTANSLSNLGSSLFYVGRYEEAARKYQLAVQLAPENFSFWGNLGEALSFVSGKEQEARDAFFHAIDLGEKRLEVNPDDARTRATLASYFARTGSRSKALNLLHDSLEASQRGMQEVYFRAVTFTALGEEESALLELELAVELGFPRVLIAKDGNFARLHRLPQFMAIVALENHVADMAASIR